MRQLPPVETRFPVNRKDHTQKGPYAKCAFTRLMKQSWPMQDPTGKLQKIKGMLAPATAIWWEALRGDVNAAREIFDRVDGKVLQKTEFSGTVNMLPALKIGKTKADYQVG